MAVLSDTCILVLQSATAAACVEALNSAPPSELWTLVLAVVNPVIRAHAQMHMERVSCMAKVPDELLVSIFEHLDFGDRIRAATVCQRWRTVSLDAVSALWSDIPNQRNVHTYDTLLARARDLPVSVTYAPEGVQDLETFGNIIFQNTDRIKGMRFVFPQVDYEDVSVDAAIEHLPGIVDRPAPILETLFLSDSEGTICRVYPSLLILTSPNLRSIELEGFDLSYLEVCTDSQSLRALEISTNAAYETLHRDHWSYLTRLPALESLALDLPNVVAVDTPLYGQSLALSLKYLRLEVHPVVLDALVTVEDLSRFQTLDISFLYQSAEIEWLAERLPFLRNATVSAAVSSNASSLFLTAADSSGRKRIFTGLKLDENWHTLLPNVQKLRLTHLPNPESGTAAANFRALEQLTLDVTLFSLAIPFGNPRPLTLPTFLCPRLRTVHFKARNTPRRLPADMVLHFLRRTLASSDLALRRLDRLELDRVTLNPAHDQPHIAAALSAIAQNVAMVDSGEVLPEVLRLWDRETD